VHRAGSDPVADLPHDVMGHGGVLRWLVDHQVRPATELMVCLDAELGEPIEQRRAGRLVVPVDHQNSRSGGRCQGGRVEPAQIGQRLRREHASGLHDGTRPLGPGRIVRHGEAEEQQLTDVAATGDDRSPSDHGVGVDRRTLQKGQGGSDPKSHQHE
jgi:hypothetical protein